MLAELGLFAVIVTAEITAVLSPVSASPLSDAPAATLRGRVVDGAGAVADADVSLSAPGAAAGDAHRTRTDSVGRWEVSGVIAGRYVIRVLKLGYEPASIVVVIGTADTAVTVTLRRAVARLDTVTVTSDAMPAHYGSNSRMVEFYRRRAAGRGTFFTREEIEKSGHSDLVPLIRRLPGARLKTFSSGEATVAFARCGATGGRGGLPRLGGTGRPPTPPNVPTPDEIQAMRSIAVYLNGMRLQESTTPEVLGRLRTSEIEAIEVYRGPSELPTEAVGNACAAIYIWTRFGAGV